jgi:hypothetical protein
MTTSRFQTDSRSVITRKTVEFSSTAAEAYDLAKTDSLTPSVGVTMLTVSISTGADNVAPAVGVTMPTVSVSAHGLTA